MIRSIESLKFIFSVIIVYFHLFYTKLKPYIGQTETFQSLAKATLQSSRIVECFLIIAGYFLYSGFKKNTQKTFTSFASQRFIRLWPVLAFYVVCGSILGEYNIDHFILDLCFLRCTGISLEYRGAIWYISPFFWCSLLIFCILKYFTKEKALLFIAIVTYFCYVVNIQYAKGSMGRELIWGWLSLGSFRVFGGLGVGVILGAIYESWFRKGSLSPSTKFALFSLIETVAFTTVMWNFTIAKLYTNSFTTIILFSMLFFCTLCSGGVISRILSCKVLAYCGRYCYSIYVMQQIAFWIMTRAYWKSHTEIMQQHPGWSIAFSLLFSVLVGILTYYLIEAPSVALWKKYKATHHD